MTKRREFPKSIKAAIIRRATRDGVTHCEVCGLATTRFDIDHTIPDALYLDKRRPLTADDGKLLCAGSRGSCHGRKTAEQDVPTIAKAKRNEARHLGLRSRGPLAGADADERRARRDARSADRAGGKPPVPPRWMPPGFVPATER